jgi:hypothetical protein
LEVRSDERGVFEFLFRRGELLAEPRQLLESAHRLP